MGDTTTIQISKETKEKLNAFKEYKKETYDEVIVKLIELAEEDKMEFSEETRKAIEEGREDIKMGRVLSTKELIKELGI
ncbi:MAG: hypothetical protein FE048_01300 [Thermoplasmata archaeon]|nr:MAG: hypothetical protein FE048_01300 [Thermoplasmata archaeon]